MKYYIVIPGGKKEDNEAVTLGEAVDIIMATDLGYEIKKEYSERLSDSPFQWFCEDVAFDFARASGWVVQSVKQ